MILVNVFSVSLSWSSSPSIPIILSFCLLRISQISWMFCVNSLLDLMLSLVHEFISSSYLQPLRVSLPCFVFCSSTSYSGCLSLDELFLFCSVFQAATEVSFSILSCSVLLGCSHSLCFIVTLLVLSAGTSSVGCLDNRSQVSHAPDLVAVHSPLCPLSIVFQSTTEVPFPGVFFNVFLQKLKVHFIKVFNFFG